MSKKKLNLTDHPAYKAALDKLRRVEGELADTQTRVQALIGVINAGQRASGRIEHEAARLLEGVEVEAVEQSPWSEYESLSRRVPVLTTAVELQRRAVDAARRRASKELVTPLVPQHRELVAKCTRTLLECCRVLDAERKMRDELDQAGIAYQVGGIAPMLPLFGNPREGCLL